jgi:hypothetical protein
MPLGPEQSKSGSTHSAANLAYSTFSPYGYSGAFYYGKVAYNW